MYKVWASEDRRVRRLKIESMVCVIDNIFIGPNWLATLYNERRTMYNTKFMDIRISYGPIF